MSAPARPFVIEGALGPIRGEARVPGGSDSFPAVVVLHGFKGFKDFAFFPYVAEGLADAGMAVVSFNFSGNGIGADPERFSELDKFARNSVSAMLEDLGRVVSALDSAVIAPGADTRRLGFFGHSLGGGMAILAAAAEARVRALAAWGAVSRFDRWSAEELRLWKERGYHEVVNQRTGQVFRMGRTWLADLEANAAGRLDVLGAAGRLRCPLLLVHGAEDETVPVEESRSIEAAARRSEAGLGGRVAFRIVEGTGHTFGAVHPFPGTNPALEEARAATIRFLAERLLGEDPARVPPDGAPREAEEPR